MASLNRFLCHIGQILAINILDAHQQTATYIGNMYIAQYFTLPKTYNASHITASFQYPQIPRAKPATSASPSIQKIDDGSKERIRKLFKQVEISVSAYDTAWVAMVPSSTGISGNPLFPECLDWLLENQNDNGSWGLHPFLLKDTLSSTLASVLALKRWGVGRHQISMGVKFLDSNFHLAIDKNHHSPTGFDIIFPGMLDYAKDLDLKLPLEPTLYDALFRNREIELNRCYKSEAHERDAYLAYVSEGIGKSQNWKMVMKHQRKNGSLFNSPATTAVALVHHLPSDTLLLDYIQLLLKKFGNAVPTYYPGEIYVRLCLIDNLQRLGIDWHFRNEIQSVLDETYSCWEKGDEEIFMDISTCAKAFRLLRMDGYNVSSDPLIRAAEEHVCVSSSGLCFKGLSNTIDLYRASQIVLYPDESNLRNQNSKSSHILKHALSNDSFCSSDRMATYIRQEVDDALKFSFYTSLERMESRRNIEQYSADCSVIQVLKSSYCSPNIGNKDFLKLAVEDFNFIQSIHREEINSVESWVTERKLDTLKFARQREAYCLFSAAATFYTPDLSDARIIWAQNGVLVIIIDQFFETAGSQREFLDLIRLTEKWDIESDISSCSKEVGILFSAIHNANTDIAEKAFKCQGRSVANHILVIWMEYLQSLWIESEWERNKYVPSIDEYMENSYVTFGLGPIVLPSLYVVGEDLSEEAVCSTEFNKMFQLMSSCGRLINDIRTLERETLQGKLNIVHLLMIHCGITQEEAIDEARNMLQMQTEELLSLVVKKGGLVPRACKELYWKMVKVMNLFYDQDDGLTTLHLMNAVNDVIYQPL